MISVVAAITMALALSWSRQKTARRRRRRKCGKQEGIESKKKGKNNDRRTHWFTTPTAVCYSEAEYRSAVRSIVKKGDNVIELGCHEGVTTVLCKRCWQGHFLR